jgi:hypothetical protein
MLNKKILIALCSLLLFTKQAKCSILTTSALQSNQHDHDEKTKTMTSTSTTTKTTIQSARGLDSLHDSTIMQDCPYITCKGDAKVNGQKFKIVTKTGNKKIRKSCKWAVRKNRDKRCSYREVQLNCCDTCNIRCAGDAAQNGETFPVPEYGEKDCDWAAANVVSACDIPIVQRMCCDSCSGLPPPGC